jgi:hypothetical protein
MLYRLYTQDKNRRFICELVSKYFPGFSIIKQTGYWQGKKECSLCIEIISDMPSVRHNIDLICRAIKGHNNQSAVLVYCIEGETLLI